MNHIWKKSSLNSLEQQKSSYWDFRNFKYERCINCGILLTTPINKDSVYMQGIYSYGIGIKFRSPSIKQEDYPSCEEEILKRVLL